MSRYSTLILMKNIQKHLLRLISNWKLSLSSVKKHSPNHVIFSLNQGREPHHLRLKNNYFPLLNYFLPIKTKENALPILLLSKRVLNSKLNLLKRNLLLKKTAHH
jgi:hypothetical protein